MMCVLLYTFYGSAFTLIGFDILRYVFKILFTIPATCVLKISIVHKVVERAIYNEFFYMLSAKDQSYDSLLLTCCSDLPNITFWHFKLLCNLPQIHLLATQYSLYLTIFEELQESNKKFRINNHFYNTMRFVCSLIILSICFGKCAHACILYLI